jgi:acetyl esterase/lipase
MTALAYTLSVPTLLMSIFLLLRLRAPTGFMLWFPKLAAASLSLLWGLTGLCGAVLGWLGGAPLAVAAGAVGALCTAWYLTRIAFIKTGFDQAFGTRWPDRIDQPRKSQLVPRRWTLFLPDPKGLQVCWERDVVFAAVPGTGRDLLCDIWQPSKGALTFGLALVYLHGSAWTVLDKDIGTRPFFRHLVAQGHVVMDVAYRLCPEVDLFGMIGDVKRAIAWIKANSRRYRVGTDGIVLAGASAGGHLSMLAAYAPYEPSLTPDDLAKENLLVRGVISYYGPSDLRALYFYTHQDRLISSPKIPIGQAEALKGFKKMANAGRLDMLLGGHPTEVPEIYDLASPITHVRAGCPPMLLIQGEDDLITPVEATRALHRKLVEAGVPAVNVVSPATTHAFDLILPRISPPAQSALYDVECFLVMLAYGGETDMDSAAGR